MKDRRVYGTITRKTEIKSPERMDYLHLAIQLCFAILSVYTLIKNRNILQFLLSLFLVIIAVALDIDWLQVRLH